MNPVEDRVDYDEKTGEEYPSVLLTAYRRVGYGLAPRDVLEQRIFEKMNRDYDKFDAAWRKQESEWMAREVKLKPASAVASSGPEPVEELIEELLAKLREGRT